MADKGWIDALGRGDEGAWLAYFEEVGPIVEAVTRRLGLPREERDEVFQVTALRVFSRSGGLREPGSFTSWVYGIALRLAIDVHRRERMRTGALGVLSNEGQAAQLEPAVIADLERLEELARLEDALGSLPQRCRDILRALYLCESAPSYEEISRRLDIPIGSIGPTRARCLKRLSEHLQDVSGAQAAESTAGNQSIPR